MRTTRTFSLATRNMVKPPHIPSHHVATLPGTEHQLVRLTQTSASFHSWGAATKKNALAISPRLSN